MKLKKGFILRDIAGECVVVSTNAELNLNGMITLNDTGRTLWKVLEKETDLDALTAALLAEYEVEETTARTAAEKFVEKLKEMDFLE